MRWLDAQQRPLTYPDGSAVGHLREGRRYAFEVVFDYGDWASSDHTASIHNRRRPESANALDWTYPCVSIDSPVFAPASMCAHCGAAIEC